MGHYTFAVKFHGNSVSVLNTGSVNIFVGDDVYVLKKAMPDILIRNVFEILGKHSVVWTGLMTVEASSKYRAECEFVVEGSDNVMRGKIWQPDQEEPLYEFKGTTTDGEIYYYDPSWGKKERKKKQMLLGMLLCFALDVGLVDYLPTITSFSRSESPHTTETMLCRSFQTGTQLFNECLEGGCAKRGAQ